jgi:hypothetical protein
MALIYTRARGRPSVAALSRRSFLLAATTGTAAIAAALIIKKQPPKPQDNKLRADSTNGYQITEHIRNYYRTAKV